MRKIARLVALLSIISLMQMISNVDLAVAQLPSTGCPKSFAAFAYERYPVAHPLKPDEREAALLRRVHDAEAEVSGLKLRRQLNEQSQSDLLDLRDEIQKLQTVTIPRERGVRIAELGAQVKRLESSIEDPKLYRAKIAALQIEIDALKADLYLISAEKSFPKRLILSAEDFPMLAPDEVQQIADRTNRLHGTEKVLAIQQANVKLDDLADTLAAKLVAKTQEQLPTMVPLDFSHFKARSKLIIKRGDAPRYEDSYFSGDVKIDVPAGHFFEAKNTDGTFVRGVVETIDGRKLKYRDAQGVSKVIPINIEHFLISCDAPFVDHIDKLYNLSKQRWLFAGIVRNEIRASLAELVSARIEAPVSSVDLLKQIFERRGPGGEVRYKSYKQTFDIPASPSTRRDVLPLTGVPSDTSDSIRVVALTVDEFEQLPTGTRVLDITSNEPRKIVIGFSQTTQSPLLDNESLEAVRLAGDPSSLKSSGPQPKLSRYGLSPDPVPEPPPSNRSELKESFREYIEAYRAVLTSARSHSQ